MKTKITKTVFHLDGSTYICESLYNFASILEARKRLQNIKSLCRYPIMEEGKNFFTANRYGNVYCFRIERQ